MNDGLMLKIKGLNLAGIYKTAGSRVEQAGRESLSHLEFLEVLINDEYASRGRNRRERLMSEARFPQRKTMEEFNFSYQPGLNRSQIYNLATCEFIRKKENIAFIGAPGVGKSHLSIAIGANAIEQGYTVLFAPLSEMLEDLYMSRADNSFRQKLKKYAQPDLLVVDELGLKKLNQTSVDDFYDVVSKRYEAKSTIITTNKPFDEWGHIFYDMQLASAILDRFVHHCNFVVIDGPSYRMRDRSGEQLSRKVARPGKEIAREPAGPSAPSSAGGAGEEGGYGQNM
jgi:DNA replication protein DnaC